MMDTWRYRVSCHTDAATLRLMRGLTHFVARAGGAVEEVAQDIQLAVGEVLSNAARHAYPNTVGSIEIDYRLTDGRFHIGVQNHGGPITDLIEVPNERPAFGQSNGLGLYAVGQLMDEVEVSVNSHGDGVAIRMSKDLT